MGRKKSDEPQDNSQVTATLGRPTLFTDELGSIICEGISEGKSLKTICRDDGMPQPRSVFNWLRVHKDFLHNYEAAVRERTTAMAEDIIEISDDGTNDYMEDDYNKGKTPGYALNGENIQRSRLRVDTRKWLMSKMEPKKYGDKMDVTSNGESVIPILGGIVQPKDDK